MGCILIHLLEQTIHLMCYMGVKFVLTVAVFETIKVFAQLCENNIVCTDQ